MTTLAGYTRFGGKHAETAALANVLASQGIAAPHNGLPYSEALVQGIGGGLGAGYILWEFKEHHAKVLVFGWQNRWQYPVQYYERLCERLNLTPTFHESGSPKTAARQLEEVLSAGKPVVAWVDRAHMRYLQLPDVLKGHIGHYVTICGSAENGVWVDDLAAKPFFVSADDIAAARGRITSYKNRLLEITPNDSAPDLPAIVLSGIRDCIEHLSQKSDSFSLPTFRKWGKMMTDRKNAKGWHVVFADRRGLYGALKSVYEGIELISTGGGLRGLYADFLDEAADIVSRPALRQTAATYRNLAAQWSALADSALPDSVEPLRETKSLMRQRYDLLMSKGGEAFADMLPLTEQLGTLHGQYNRAFPMSDGEIDALFNSLSEQLLALYDAEVAALAELNAASE